MKRLHQLFSNYLLWLAVIFMSASSCRENTLMNAKISPAISGIDVYSYILPVVTHSYYDDSVVTSDSLNSEPAIQAVGTITDPFFGSMTGATYFEVVPASSTLTPYVYANDSIDSAVLVLPYSGYTYGDTATRGLTQTYQVFYMKDALTFGTNYYSFSAAAIDDVYPLSGPATVDISALKDSFGVNVVDTNYPGLRIKLNVPVLMSHVMPALQTLLTSSSPFTDFVGSFNGICVAVADSRRPSHAIPYFRLDGPGDYFSRAGILVYHHLKGSPSAAYIENYYFDEGSRCAHFNKITKSFTRSPVNSYLGSAQKNDSIVVLQNQPGPCIDVYIQGITSIPDGVINKAELIFPLLPQFYTAGNSGDTLCAPENLSPLVISNGTFPAGMPAGVANVVLDRYPLIYTSPLALLDGSLHALLSGNGGSFQAFTIDIPREVMASKAAGNDVLHLHIVGTTDFFGAFHLIAGGGAYSDSLHRAKLVISYSKLKKP